MVVSTELTTSQSASLAIHGEVERGKRPLETKAPLTGGAEGGGETPTERSEVFTNFPFRIGQGFDVHALVDGRKLVLGGVTIPHERGLAGHSDADALLHALTDALLGAVGLGDIGQHFPDTDPNYKNADSRHLLREAYKYVQQVGWQVVNVDATLHAQAPKMAPHTPRMTANIAEDLGIAPSAVNIKAKTNEGLGYLGRGEGIAANVVVLLARPGSSSKVKSCQASAL